MFTKSMIALIAFLVVAGAAHAAEWQPSWAPEPLPVEAGRAYRTGSPLSQPGILGLLGGIANGVTGGELPEWTGGGFTIWHGPGAQPPVCGGVEINGVCLPTLTQAEARSAQEKVDWTKTENKPRATVPTCTDGQLWVTMVPDSELGTRLVYSCQGGEHDRTD